MNSMWNAAIATVVPLKIGLMQNGRCSDVSHRSKVLSRSRVTRTLSVQPDCIRRSSSARSGTFSDYQTGARLSENTEAA